ncbi:MAG: TRAP transporter substrate-binding protein [Rubrivivax sp.]|nr:TRAP transporter substrate-binding protein [Rubrivivax sp.]
MTSSSVLRKPARTLLMLALAGGLAAPPLAGAQEPITLRTGAFAPPGSPFAVFWQQFKANVERDSKGTIKVDLNTNDPNEGNLLSNLRRGRVDCVGASLQGTSTILPEVAVLQLPYLFTSFRQVDHVYDAGLLDTYRKLFAARGVELLRFVEVGFTHLYGTAAIKAPADLKGVKLRATQARASQAFVSAIGAEPVVLPIAEAMPGLQTGLIKGGESGIVVYAAVLSNAAKHYTLTAHAFDSGTVMCNREWFGKLTPEQQTAVRNGWDSKAQAIATRAANDKFLAEGAAAKGVTVYRPTAAEQALWQAAGKKAADELLAAQGPEGRRIYDEIQKDLAKLK